MIRLLCHKFHSATFVNKVGAMNELSQAQKSHYWPPALKANFEPGWTSAQKLSPCHCCNDSVTHSRNELEIRRYFLVKYLSCCLLYSYASRSWDDREGRLGDGALP